MAGVRWDATDRLVRRECVFLVDATRVIPISPDLPV